MSSSRNTSRTHSATSRPNSPNFINRLPLVVAILSVIGAGIAAYLTYTHYNKNALVCQVGNCGSVQSSEYATIGPVPVALLGLGMFVAFFALAIVRALHQAPLSYVNATIASWIIALSGIVYFIYLTYLEIWVIEAICQWCVASSMITLAILAIETVLVWRVLGEPADLDA